MLDNLGGDLFAIDNAAKETGLWGKKWFRIFWVLFLLFSIGIPLLIPRISDYFGYEKVEEILIYSGLFVCLFLLGFASFHLFKKEGDSKLKSFFQALAIPLAFIIPFALIAIVALITGR